MSRRGGDSWWLLAALVVLAFTLRVVGLSHGLPWVVGPDEGFEVHRALRLGAGEFDLERTGKGGLFYLLFLEYAAYFVGLWVVGAVESSRDFALRFAADPTPFWMLGRLTSAVLGTLLVPATWWLGRRLYGPVAAVFAAAVVAVTPVHVKSAHTINVDLPMALMVIVTLLLASHQARIVPDSRPRPVALGLALGGAMLCKIPAVTAAIPVWLATAMGERGHSGWKRWFGGDLWRIAAAAAAIFVVGNPGVVAAFGITTREIVDVLAGSGPGSGGAASGAAEVNLWAFYAGAVRRAVGTPLAVLIVVGVLWAIHGAVARRREADRLLLAFLVPTVLLFALARTSEHYYDRYVIPWIPVLAILGGAFAADVWKRLQERPVVTRVVTATLLAALTIPPLGDSIAVASDLRRADTREAALEWLEENAPPHSRVFVVGNPMVRSALTVPLRRPAADLERWAAELEAEGHSKSEILEARAALEEGVPYEVVGVRHDAPNDSLDRYLEDEVRYFVLDLASFAPDRVSRDRKLAGEVRENRVALYESIQKSEEVRLAWSSAAAAGEGRSGPRLEIYEADAPPVVDAPLRGTVEVGRLIEVGLGGPALSPRGEPNPFAIDVTVVLVPPGGESVTLPGFYGRPTVERGAGDVATGSGPWRFRLRPWLAGEWSFRTSSSRPELDGIRGRIAVAPSPEPTRGRLLATDRPYLRFEDGTWWLKGGCDDPEDFLAKGVMGDWKEKRRGLEYLASRGVNSIYLMPHTVEGDGDNVWPWIERKRSDRFDIEKLARWDDLFSHAQELGIVLHLVLEDDSGWTGFDRRLYYRELVARFAHHPALIWNVSEEFDENYSPTEIRTFAKMLDELDPYDHPITVHHTSGTTLWKPFLEDPRFTVTSFQTEKEPQNRRAREWRERARAAGRALVVSFDETGAAEPEDRDLLRHIAWSVYLGGANYELHVREMKDFRDFEATWDDLRRARAFVESMPFWEMEPCNERIAEGRGYCYGTAEEAPAGPWAVYLPEGGTAVLELPPAPAGSAAVPTVRWYDPRSGEWHDGSGTLDGSKLRIESPISGDAAVRVEFEPAP